MLRKSLILFAALALQAFFAAQLAASTSDKALRLDGTLISLSSSIGGLVVTIEEPGSEPTASVVPGTDGDIILNPTVGVDEPSGTVVVVWQENVDNVFFRIQLATFCENVWSGPETLAGHASSWAINPAILLHRSILESEEGLSIETAFIHVAWWEGSNLDDGGSAKGTSIPLVDGVAILDDHDPIELHDLIPYGIACDMTGKEVSLKHPMLFIDPQTGSPHLIFVDLRDCLFGIMELAPERPPVTVTDQRRRNIAVWRSRMIIPVHPELVLAGAKFDVGHDLAVVMYWDQEDSIEYAVLNESSWSEIRRLSLNEQLSREQGVALIRGLAR